MDNKGKEILSTFAKALPELSKMEKEKLLAFGEGIVFAIGKRKEEVQCRNTADTQKQPA